MATRTPWLRVLIGVAFVLGGCGPAVVSPTFAPPTESPAAAVGNLPPGCEPIDLRTTSGQAVDLNGIWIQDENEGRQPSKWWIRTLGDCIWGTGIIDEYTEDNLSAAPSYVQTLSGTIASDFTIASDIVTVGPQGTFGRLAAPIFAEVRILIEFDADGQITLREDRVRGVQGPRCLDPVGYCIQPLVLRPAG